jgi:F0F1-type ATP synthase assembly protein I
MTTPEERSDRTERVQDQIRDTAIEFQATVRKAAPVAAASYALIGAIVLLGGVGYFADQWLDTRPWLLICGLLLGIVVGFYELARVVWRRTP